MTDAKKGDEAPKNPAPGPQSTKPVAPATNAPKGNTPGEEQVKNPVTDNTSSKPEEVVKDGVAKKVEGETAPKDEGKLPNTHENPPPVSQLTEEEKERPELTKAEEAKLEALMGDDAEPSLSDDDMRRGADSAKKFQKLLSVIPKDTPDEHVVWGAGGVVITIGDVRAVFGKVRVAD